MIGAKLIRKQLNMSINDMANILGVSNQFISKWENGDKKIPKYRLQMLSEKFKVSKEILQKEVGSVKKIMITTSNGDIIHLTIE